MEIIAIVAVVGALWVGFRLGHSEGREALVREQAQALVADLDAHSDFERRTGLRGSYRLIGHDSRNDSPGDFAIVRLSELERRLGLGTAAESAKAATLDNDESGNAPRHPELLRRPTLPLARLVGNAPVTVTDATKAVWKYVESNDLQNKGQRRLVDCDEALEALTGERQTDAFQLTRAVREHLSE